MITEMSFYIMYFYHIFTHNTLATT